MSQDEDKPQLRPIPGAPPGAPNPPFPVEGKDQPTPKEPESQRVHGPDSIPGPNEIADRFEELKKRMRYADKLGLETACEIAKLLVIMVDVHKYEGKRYESFAIAHGAGNRTYAYALYRLGLVADDVILKCEAEERTNPRFHYPHWLKMVPPKPPKPPDEEGTSQPDEDEPAEPDPIAELQRERNNLEVQVKTATQQYRNERVRREEAEEQHVAARQHLESEIAALKAQIAAGIPEFGSEKALWEPPIGSCDPPPQGSLLPSIDVAEDDGEPLLPATGHPTPEAEPGHVIQDEDPIPFVPMVNTCDHEPTEPSKSLKSITTDPDRPLVAGTLRPNEIAEFGKRNDLGGFAGRKGDGRTLAVALGIRALYYRTCIDHNIAVPANLRQTRTAWASREGMTTRQINQTAEPGQPASSPYEPHEPDDPP